MVHNLIKNYKDKSLLTKDITLLWDLFKTEVLDYTIAFCKRKAKENKNEITILENKLKILNQQVNGDILQNVRIHFEGEILETEEKLEKLYENKPKGAHIRSRIKWIEEGEKKIQFCFWD